MNLRFSTNYYGGVTRVDVSIGVLILVILSVLGWCAVKNAWRKVMRVDCVNNLKQISLAFREFENDQTNLPANMTPLALMGQKIPATNVFEFFQVLSNELVTPKLLVCPADTRQPATNFALNFGNTNISYFVNLGSSESDPQMMVFGDDNLEINGVLAPSGPLTIPSQASIAWSAARHNHVGNVTFIDGSVQMLSYPAIQALTNWGSPANQIIIP